IVKAVLPTPFMEMIGTVIGVVQSSQRKVAPIVDLQSAVLAVKFVENKCERGSGIVPVSGNLKFSFAACHGVRAADRARYDILLKIRRTHMDRCFVVRELFTCFPRFPDCLRNSFNSVMIKLLHNFLSLRLQDTGL